MRSLVLVSCVTLSFGCARTVPTETGPDRSTLVRPPKKTDPPKPRPRETRKLDLAAAREVGGAFRANPVAARGKYKDVVWEMSGGVDEVHDTVTEGRAPVLVNVKLDEKYTTLVMLRVPVAEAKRLARGRDAVFTGELADYIDDANPPEPQFVFAAGALKR